MSYLIIWKRPLAIRNQYLDVFELLTVICNTLYRKERRCRIVLYRVNAWGKLISYRAPVHSTFCCLVLQTGDVCHSKRAVLTVPNTIMGFSTMKQNKVSKSVRLEDQLKHSKEVRLCTNTFFAEQKEVHHRTFQLQRMCALCSQSENGS